MNAQQSEALNIWRAAASQVSHSVDQIDKREKLSRKDFLHEYVLKNRPVILKDATKDWQAVGKWTPQFFNYAYGSKQVPVFERKSSVTLKGKIPLSEYMDEITSSTPDKPARYLFSLKIATEFPELMKDLEPQPTYWGPNWLDSKYLLPGLPRHKLRNITGLEINMGGTGSGFPFLHYDDLWTQTFITQVYGRKDWLLYPPDQTPYMYPIADADNISRIPMETDVDLGAFPLFAQAKPLRVVVEEGETLYGAPGWWHTTKALTPSIAVVLSTADGSIWSHVTRAAFLKTFRHSRWYFKPIAFPIAAYMTAFRAVKSITDPY
jgi:histone arginine demethylase JMJD6